MKTTRIAAAAVVTLLLTSCNTIILDGINQTRTNAGKPALPESSYLNQAALENSQSMCDARRAASSTTPRADYDGESAAAIRELVASERLDYSIDNAITRQADASARIWQRFKTNPEIADATWDAVGVGEVACPNGRLYATALLRDDPSMPASGRYVTPQYTNGDLTEHLGLSYGSAPNANGQPVDLKLDLYLPPDEGDGPRPAIVGIHGGSFVSGNRSNMTGVAKEAARRGFVGVTISYRLRQSTSTITELVLAARDAIDDSLEAVRWLKANAATYGIDANRIALLGSSAGGATALGAAVGDDPTPGGPLSAFAPEPAAAVSTGGHLTPGLGGLDLNESDAPVLMFHYEQDTSALKVTWDYAFQTCGAIRDSGNTCNFVRQPGSGHTISLSPNSASWSTVGPFLWNELDLAALPS